MNRQTLVVICACVFAALSLPVNALIDGASSNHSAATSMDYDGDGKADLVIRRAERGENFILQSSDNRTIRIGFGIQPTDVPVSGDFDGDGTFDIAVWRPSTGFWYIEQSSNGEIYSKRFGTQSSDIPVPADFDGDGITDIAIRRPASFEWFYLSSVSNRVIQQTFGRQASDIPVVADYDGDGKADLAVRRTSNATWYAKLSASGKLLAKRFGLQSTDIAVPADYDGDGTSDIAIFRPSNTTWYILSSATDELIQTVLGNDEGSIPIPADYDGDGKTDIAVRDAQSGIQDILYSSTQEIVEQRFGMQATDIVFASPLKFRIYPDGLTWQLSTSDIGLAEPHTDVELKTTITGQSPHPINVTWEQTSGTSALLTKETLMTSTLSVPKVTNDEVLAFTAIATDMWGHQILSQNTVKVNAFLDKHLFVRTVKVTADWQKFNEQNGGWVTAVPTKQANSGRFVEIALWDDINAVHVYEFDNEFFEKVSGKTHEEAVEIRESYRVLAFDNFPSDGEYFERSYYLRDTFIAIADYLVSSYPNYDHHFMYSGHGGPGGNLIAGLMYKEQVVEFLDSWTQYLGRNLGVIDMGGPCNKGSVADLKSFCDFTDYYVGSDLPNGGYTVDVFNFEEYLATEVEAQYLRLTEEAVNTIGFLEARIDLKRQRYLLSRIDMVANKVEQANYLYSCHQFNSIRPTLDTFMESRDNYTIYDDLKRYLEQEAAPEELVEEINKVFLLEASNRDFFEWELNANGLQMESCLRSDGSLCN